MPLCITLLTLAIFPISSSIKSRQWAAHGVQNKCGLIVCKILPKNINNKKSKICKL
ncbi:hypothetical protein Fmac_014699 [Flemingia macrophylla]|uniref:Uncharacterized protein n=1 Tax=Flemingia macrophylla TaxID=520843 RepID=A0ABD1MCG6_9FABA